jgi:hypothetical protein
MNISLAEISALLEEDFEAFSPKQLFAFFPEPLTTEFNIKSNTEAELLLSIISPNPFTVRYDSLDRFHRPGRKVIENIFPGVVVVEDDDIDFTPVELVAQYSSIDSVLEFSQHKSNN